MSWVKSVNSDSTQDQYWVELQDWYQVFKLSHDIDIKYLSESKSRYENSTQWSVYCHQSSFHLECINVVELNYHKKIILFRNFITLRIQQILNISESLFIQLQSNELLLIKNNISYHSEDSIKFIRTEVILNYFWKSHVKDQQFMTLQHNQSFIKYVSNQDTIWSIN